MKWLYTVFALLSFSCIDAQAFQFESTHLLSFEDFKSLSEVKKNNYVRKVSFHLSILDAAIKRQKLREKQARNTFDIISFILIQKAYASDLKCIGGGVFVASGAPSCGARSHAGYSCPQGKEICNPLIFGVTQDNRPICHPTATTRWCFKNTKPGYSTRLDLVFQREEARAEWDSLASNIDEICAQGNRSRIQESDRRVQSACSDLLDQKRINEERIQSGRIQTDFEPLASRLEASSGVCTDCENSAPTIDTGITELAQVLPDRIDGAQSSASPVASPVGWNDVPFDSEVARCGTDKDTLRSRARPTFPVVTQARIDSINRTLSENYNVSPVVFNRAFAFYQNNKDTIKNARYITVVDMSQRATNKRKFLIDLETGDVESYYVSHGRGSDSSQTGYVQSFGNGDETNKTPAGFHLTGMMYNGRYGSSLALHGQERGVNQQSCGRAIVIHRAIGNGGIASSNRSQGNLWRSNGCFAMNEGETQSFINRTQNGSVYYVHSGN